MSQWRRNVYVLFVAQLLSTAGFGIVFPFLPLYVKELGISTRGSIEFWSGMIFSVQAVTMMIMAPIWGTIADRYGRKPMVLRATLGGAVLLALMGFAQSAEQLAVLRAIQGMVTGIMASVNALVAASTPEEHTGEALGLLQTGRWAGVAAGPVIGGLIGDAFGFRESFWITAALLGLAGLAVLFWVHEEFIPIDQAQRPSFFGGYRAILQAPGMPSLYSLNFLRSLGFSVILPIAPLFVMQLMGTESGVASVTGVLMGVSAFAGAISAVWLGRLGDRMGRRRVLLGSAVMTVVFYLPQPFVTAAWQLVILQAFSGFAAGGMLPTVGALMNQFTRRGGQGATYGLDNSISAAARMIAPMLGSGMALWFGPRGTFGLAALIYALAGMLAIRVARSLAEQRRPQSVVSPAAGGD